MSDLPSAEEVLHELREREAAARHRRSFAPIALMLSTLSVTLSWFTFWIAPMALVALVVSVVALLRHHSHRRWAWWGFGLSLTALAYCAVWAFWILDHPL